MTSYTISSELYCCAQGSVTFPEGKTWEDVKDWYVKWDTLYVRFKDSDDYVEFSLNSYADDGATDWKHPLGVTVYGMDADGETDYDNGIASKG